MTVPPQPNPAEPNPAEPNPAEPAPPDIDRALLLDRLAASEHALQARLAGLTDQDAGRPSGLPDWTRGHLLTHVARNAETLADVVDGARRGEVLTMYGGDLQQRESDIQAGARRPPDALREDVERTSARLLAAFRGLGEPDWDRQGKRASGAPFTMGELLAARWQEVEIHHVDLDFGYAPADWPEPYVEYMLPRQLARLPERAPGVSAPDGTRRETLAWLYGRGRSGQPELPPWP